jgi:mRNA-degrading endonuclease toxin of MazEF toxin-antitoxin module
LKRGEVWWVDLGPFRPREQTGRRPVIIWQSNELTSVLQSVLVVPLTTNLDRAHLAGTAIVQASPEAGLPEDSVPSAARSFPARRPSAATTKYRRFWDSR